MTSDDDLRARLAAIDPMRPGRVNGPPRPQPAEIQERIRQIVDAPESGLQRPARVGWRRPAVVGSVVAIVLAVAVGVGILAKAFDNRPSQPSELALTVASAGTMTSCVPFDVAVLSDMPVAFAGTAIDVAADSVTIDVDRWYAGGDADRVTVGVPDPRTSVSLDGMEFVEGRRYLITATDGTVNGCGFSGPATPDLERAFAVAFAD